MIIILKEDIFSTAKTGAQAIIHQANCQCTMGSGIARNIRERFPEAYEADCQTVKGDASKLGRASSVLLSPEKQALYPNLRYIINLYGQLNYGLEKRHTSYDALAEGFERIRDWAGWNGLTKLSVPYRLGCNRAGGDWEIVSAILNSVFAKDEKITMLICENPALTSAQVSNRVSK